MNATCGAGRASDAGSTFTAPSTGTYTFDTLGSAYDTALHVHSGSCAGIELACNDDTPPSSQSQVTLPPTAGQTVLVVVDGYATSNGTYTLNIIRN